MSDEPPPVYLSSTELRDLFNRERVWERAIQGELYLIVRASNHPSSPLAAEPFCTQSIMFSISDFVGGEMVLVATAHAYLRPDGKYGASGRGDPKAMIHDGRWYVLA